MPEINGWMIGGHNYRNCEKHDCDECQSLIDDDIIMACDICDQVGDKESFGWRMLEDGRIVCEHCEHDIAQATAQKDS